MPISFRHHGDFDRANRYFQRLKQVQKRQLLDKYGRMGVTALASNTPVDTGLTAASWSYVVEKTSGGEKIVFTNSNIQNGQKIAILIQYGHGTGTGGYVVGRDYINPALQPVFQLMAEELWREVTRL